MKKYTALLLALIMLLAFAGCAKTVTSEQSEEESVLESESISVETKKDTLAICMLSVEHPANRLVQYGFIKTAEELGYKTKIVGLKEGTDAEQLAEWKKVLEDEDIAGVAVWTGLDLHHDFLKECHEKGLHVVVPYNYQNYKNAHEFVDYNPFRDRFHNTDEGIIAAEFLMQKLSEKGITEGSIGVMINGGTGSQVDFACENFRETMVNGGFTLYDTWWEPPAIEEGANKAEEYITQYPDMIAAFADSATGAKTWTEAIKRTGREDIIVMTYANGLPVDDYLADYYIIEPLYEAGAEAAKGLAALNDGKVFASEEEWQPYLPINIVDKGAYAEYEARYNEAQAYFAQ